MRNADKIDDNMKQVVITEEAYLNAYGEFKEIKSFDYKREEKAEKLLLKILYNSRYRIQYHEKFFIESIQKLLRRHLNQYGIFCKLIYEIEFKKHVKFSIAKEYYDIIQDYVPFMSADVKMAGHYFTKEDIEYYQDYFKTDKDIEIFLSYNSKDSVINLIEFAIENDVTEWYEAIVSNLGNVVKLSENERERILFALSDKNDVKSILDYNSNYIPLVTLATIKNRDFIENYMKHEGEGPEFRFTFTGLTPEIFVENFKDILILIRDIPVKLIFDRKCFVGSLGNFYHEIAKCVSYAGMQSAYGTDSRYAQMIKTRLVKPFSEVFTNSEDFVNTVQCSEGFALMMLAFMSIRQPTIDVLEEFMGVLVTNINREKITYEEANEIKIKEEDLVRFPYLRSVSVNLKDIYNYGTNLKLENETQLGLLGLVWMYYMKDSNINYGKLSELIPTNMNTAEKRGFLVSFISVFLSDSLIPYTSIFRCPYKRDILFKNENIIDIVRYILEILMLEDFKLNSIKKSSKEEISLFKSDYESMSSKSILISLSLLSVFKLIHFLRKEYPVVYLNATVNSPTTRIMNVTEPLWMTIGLQLTYLLNKFNIFYEPSIKLVDYINDFVNLTNEFEFDYTLDVNQMTILIDTELQLVSPRQGLLDKEDISHLMRELIGSIINNTFEERIPKLNHLMKEILSSNRSLFAKKVFMNSLFNAFFYEIERFTNIEPYVSQFNNNIEEYEKAMKEYIHRGFNAIKKFATLIDTHQHTAGQDVLIYNPTLAMVGLAYQLQVLFLSKWNSEFWNDWDFDEFDNLHGVFQDYIVSYWEYVLENLDEPEHKWASNFSFPIKAYYKKPNNLKSRNATGIMIYQPNKFTVDDVLIRCTVNYMKVDEASHYIKEFMIRILKCNEKRPRSSAFLFLTEYFGNWGQFLNIKDFIEVEKFFENTIPLYDKKLQSNGVTIADLVKRLDKVRASLLLNKTRYIGYNGNKFVGTLVNWFIKNPTEEDAKGIIRFIESGYKVLSEKGFTEKMERGRIDEIVKYFYLTKILKLLEKVVNESQYNNLLKVLDDFELEHSADWHIGTCRVNFKEEFSGYYFRDNINCESLSRNIRYDEETMSILTDNSKYQDTFINIFPVLYGELLNREENQYFVVNQNIIVVKLPVKYSIEDYNLILAISNPEFYGDMIEEMQLILSESFNEMMFIDNTTSVAIVAEHIYNKLKSDNTRGLLYLCIEEM